MEIFVREMNLMTKQIRPTGNKRQNIQKFRNSQGGRPCCKPGFYCDLGLMNEEQGSFDAPKEDVIVI